MLPTHADDHPDRIQITFDDHRLVANILPATLGQRLTGTWTFDLVASALAGGDCQRLLRTGGTAGTRLRGQGAIHPGDLSAQLRPPMFGRSAPAKIACGGDDERGYRLLAPLAPPWEPAPPQHQHLTWSLHQQSALVSSVRGPPISESQLHSLPEQARRRAGDSGACTLLAATCHGITDREGETLDSDIGPRRDRERQDLKYGEPSPLGPLHSDETWHSGLGEPTPCDFPVLLLPHWREAPIP